MGFVPESNPLNYLILLCICSGNTQTVHPFLQKMMVSILSIVLIWILRFDQILAGITIDAESITGDQIAKRDDTTNFYNDI